MRQLLLLFLFIAVGIPALGQEADSVGGKFTLSGRVSDAKTGEDLIGATIIIKELRQTGTVTNAYGYYSITIPRGSYTVLVQFIGYRSNSQTVTLAKNLRLDVHLEEKAVEQNEVVVTGEKLNENVARPQMGIDKLTTQEMKTVPVLLGEKDLMKTIQLLPGVKSAGEGNTGFYVRGGAVDQNLILLDEAPVYNASHLVGFFSVFNSDAVKDVALYKGEMPAQYGGRLSSVLDIKMKDGNNKRFGVNGGIGLISSRLNVEGPLVTDKGSFILSGRRTYADLFLKLSSDTSINKSRLYFYDLNAKINYMLGENDRLFLSGYFGQDVLGFGDTFGIHWGNTTGTLRWNHLFNVRLFSNTSIIASDYKYAANSTLGGSDLNLDGQILDYGLKQDFQYYADINHSVKFGFNSIYHNINPGAITVAANNRVSGVTLTHKYAWDNAFYVSDEVKPAERISIETGIRFSLFSLVGPGNLYSYNAAGETTDSTYFPSGTFIKTYGNLEPRASVSFILDEESSLKAAYGRNVQNLHLLSNSTTNAPTDLWIPSSNNIQPEIADQVSLGYFRNFASDLYEFSAEVYYKHLQHQIDYKDGADITLNENVESQLLFGSGKAYGIELFLKKKFGRLNGWIGYTLSRADKSFDGIDNGRTFPARQDRTHDVVIVGSYALTDHWTFSSSWVYYTGDAVTFPSGKYEVAGIIANYYTERNGYRMPPYHRLDFGATYEGEHSSWTFSLYNVYARENAYTITFRQSTTDPTKTEAVQTSLFRLVPSVTYNFKF